MVDKVFEKITYQDVNGNVKGVFQEFQFASTGPSAPYNEGHGQNLIVNRETRKEKVPHMGFRAPLKIEQNMVSGDSTTQIAFTTPQTRQDQYGMLFAVKFLADTEKADDSMSVITVSGGVNTTQSIKGLGAITVNGNAYHYFLANIAADTQSRTETTVQFNFTSSKLKDGKMALEIYEGFTFNNFSNSDYSSANITTHLPYPHQKDFDKHKFQDAMVGDVLLAGMKQADGTILVTNLGTPDINSASDSTALVNKNALETGGLVGIRSFSQTVQGLFPHRLLMAKGNVGNLVVIHRDPSIKDDQNAVALTPYARGVWLDVLFKVALPEGIYKYAFDLYFTTNTNFKVYLSGECGESGYQATTYYEHWSSGSAKGTDTQNNAVGGFFHAMFGSHVHVNGQFRNFGTSLVNYGISYGMNQSGAHNEFLLQKLVKNSDQTTLLGKEMRWRIENIAVGTPVTLDNKSYFYIEKVQNI